MLTLWATVVAERLGFGRDEALTLGKAVAGLAAQSKGRRLGIYEASKPDSSKATRAHEPQEVRKVVALLGRHSPVTEGDDGIRAVVKDKPTDPAATSRYLEQKFGDALDDVRTAMVALAEAYNPKELDAMGNSLYEEFRPEIPEGIKGWGAKGTLDLDLIRKLATKP